MLGHRKPHPPTELYHEHNQKLQTPIEVAEAFRRRLQNTFRISPEDNLVFSQESEEEVSRWYRDHLEELTPRPIVTFQHSKFTTDSITNIPKSFKEKSPGPLREGSHALHHPKTQQHLTSPPP